MDLIYRPLGWLLGTIYNFVGSYGLALVLFTIVIKLVLFPLSMHQQKSMSKMAGLQPKMQEIQRKYKNNKEKQSQELMKLYEKEKVSPTAGCLPLVIQFPILIGLYGVITRPLQYMMGLTVEQITNAVNTLNLVDTSTAETAEKAAQLVANFVKGNQIKIADAISQNLDKLPDLSGFQMIDFNFLGLNLAGTPSENWKSVLIIIPILAAVTSYLSSWYSMRRGPSAAMQNDQAAGMNKTMMFTMPLMSLWFTFTFPAGIGVYWIISSLMMMAQQFLLNRIIPVQQAKPLTKEELKLERKKERQQELEEKRQEAQRLQEEAKKAQQEAERLAKEEAADEDGNSDENEAELPAPETNDGNIFEKE